MSNWEELNEMRIREIRSRKQGLKREKYAVKYQNKEYEIEIKKGKIYNIKEYRDHQRIFFCPIVRREEVMFDHFNPLVEELAKTTLQYKRKTEMFQILGINA